MPTTALLADGFRLHPSHQTVPGPLPAASVSDTLPGPLLTASVSTSLHPACVSLHPDRFPPHPASAIPPYSSARRNTCSTSSG